LREQLALPYSDLDFQADEQQSKFKLRHLVNITKAVKTKGHTSHATKWFIFTTIPSKGRTITTPRVGMGIYIHTHQKKTEHHRYSHFHTYKFRLQNRQKKITLHNFMCSQHLQIRLIY
jgi:hypothetical protein